MVELHRDRRVEADAEEAHGRLRDRADDVVTKLVRVGRGVVSRLVFIAGVRLEAEPGGVEIDRVSDGRSRSNLATEPDAVDRGAVEVAAAEDALNASPLAAPAAVRGGGGVGPVAARRRRRRRRAFAARPARVKIPSSVPVPAAAAAAAVRVPPVTAMILLKLIRLHRLRSRGRHRRRREQRVGQVRQIVALHRDRPRDVVRVPHSLFTSSALPSRPLRALRDRSKARPRVRVPHPAVAVRTVAVAAVSLAGSRARGVALLYAVFQVRV